MGERYLVHHSYRCARHSHASQSAFLYAISRHSHFACCFGTTDVRAKESHRAAQEITTGEDRLGESIQSLCAVQDGRCGNRRRDRAKAVPGCGRSDRTSWPCGLQTSLGVALARTHAREDDLGHDFRYRIAYESRRYYTFGASPVGIRTDSVKRYGRNLSSGICPEWQRRCHYSSVADALLRI